MSGLELLESERRNLGFWGQNFDIDPRVSANVDNGLLKGTGIVIDPRDSGQISLLNGINRNRVQNMVNVLDDEKRHQMLLELAKDVHIHDIKIEDLGKKTRALYRIAEDIISAREYASESAMGVASDIANSISGVMYRLPGVNVVWASTFGIAADVLDWYVESEATEIMKRSLSMSRSLFLDNVMTNTVADGLDRRLANESDNDSRVEKIFKWLSEKNDFFKSIETNARSGRMGKALYGNNFYTVCDPESGVTDPSLLGMIVPEISDSTPTLRYGLVDLESKTVRSDVTNFSPTAMTNAVESLRYQFSAKHRNKRMKHEGTLPYMADERSIVERYNYVPKLLSNMSKGFDMKEISKSILQLFQSGKKN